MKNHQYNDSGTRKIERKTSKKEGFNKPNNIEEKEEETKEEKSQPSFAQKNRLREGPCY